jgi:L-alanine-DL-glutamate epimerase-like enolase superfamily enzyme
MITSRLAFISLPIPFRGAFGHASAVRTQAENIIVLVEDAEGQFGIGEGCPRPYVTGESIETAFAFLTRRRADILSSVDGPEALDAWMNANEAEIDANPSAFCAVELALLDLFSRQRTHSLEQLLGVGGQPSGLVTSAVYGSGGWLKFIAQALLLGLNGMHDAKLKVSGNCGRDNVRAALLSTLGKVRLDANNFWPDWGSAVKGLALSARHAWAVEEPVQPRDWAGMVRVAETTGLSIILDESFTRIDDILAIPASGKFILNLRVSKLGGLKRTLRALHMAADRNLKVVVGAQVGETSILARAGIIVAHEAGGALIGYEGAYGTHLLQWDAVTPSLTFGRGGKLSARNLAIEPLGAGLRPTAKILNLFARAPL